MGTEHVPTRLSAIVRPDPRLEFWPSESGIFDAGGTRLMPLGQASPRAGIPAPVASSDLALRASGSLVDSIEAYCNRAGLAVLDEVGLLWGLEGASGIGWYGCDLPVPIAGWQTLTDPAQRGPDDIIDTGDGTLIVSHHNAGAIPPPAYIYTQTFDAANTSWGAEVAVRTVVGISSQSCLLVMPSGRVHCYYWEQSGTDYQIGYSYSDDNGATWTYGGHVLEDTVSATTYAARRLRVIRTPLDGVITIFASLRAPDTGAGIFRDRIAQFASSNGGHRFTQITISDGSDEEHAGDRMDVCLWRGEIVLARLSYRTAGTVEVRVRRLASGWYPWTSGEELAQTGPDAWGDNLGVAVAPVPATSDGYISEGDLALWAESDGSLYITARHCAGAYDGACPIMRSTDGGETWLATGSSALYAGRGQAWYWTGSSAEEALSLSACATRARSVIAHTWSRSGVDQLLMGVTWLGGWQNTTMPSSDGTLFPTRRVSWEHSGTAQQLPEECGWTYTPVAGAPVVTIGGGLLNAVCAGGENAIWHIAPTTTLPQGYIAELAVDAKSGTGTFRGVLQDATPKHYEIEVQVSTAQITLRDVVAGGVVGAPLAYSNGPVVIRVDHQGASVRVLAHDPTQALPTINNLCSEERTWVEVAKTAALAPGGGAVANRIEFRADVSSDVDFYWWPFVAGSYCGQHIYTQAVSDRMPRSVIETPQWFGRGGQLSSVSGPGEIGDRWLIPATADYPYDAPLPHIESSPQHGYRSGTFDVEPLNADNFRLSYQIGDVPEYLASPLLVMLVDGISFGGAEVWLYYGGAWTLAKTIGYWEATCHREGSTLVVTSATPNTPVQIRRDELVCCLAEYVSGGPPAAQVDYQHRIVSNEPGIIDTTAASVPLRFEVDGHAPAEPANPLVRIYPRRALVVVDLDNHADAIRGIQIRAPMNAPAVGLPAPPAWPPEDYIELATLAAGGAWLLGTRHGWGRRLAIESDTEVITAEDGTRASYERGPARRRWSQTWADPVVMRELLVNAPDYVAFSVGGTPAAFRRFTPQDLADTLRTLAGAGTVVLWCEALDSGYTGANTRWADGASLARLMGAVERDLFVGDEERNPAERLQDLTFEEEV